MAKSRVRARAHDDVTVVRYDKGGKPITARQRKDGWTPVRRKKFLETLANTCNVSAACHAAGMSSGAIYPLRQRDAAFRAAWGDALREGYFRLETAMLDRAINGVPKPIYYHGDKIDTVQEFNEPHCGRMLARHQAAALASPDGVLDDATIAEARLTIERRVRAIKLRRARMAENADNEKA